jgi:hypothetical protein
LKITESKEIMRMLDDIGEEYHNLYLEITENDNTETEQEEVCEVLLVDAIIYALIVTLERSYFSQKRK